MNTELIQIAPALIAPSLTNPRKTFNAERLAELAESIKTSGVHSPLLLRRLPAARMHDTFRDRPEGAELPTHELVTGERRLRASIMAYQALVPALVRELTDDEVLEIQIIENLQRDDLSELEEAEGYEMLMQHGHNGERFTVDQVAAKIGKSRSYVYARLKLLDLIPASRDAMREGKLDASKGLLLARIPDAKLQLQALKEITREGYNGDTMGYRSAADHVQRNYMLRLSEAKFSIKDADLVPAAGACRACPKRTGANPDLFNDVKGADVCTDPPCFNAKQDAHAALERAQAVERGQTIIDGREAKELMPNSWSSRVEGYLRLDDPADSPTDKPLRSLLAKQMATQDVHPVLVANPHKAGELVAVLKSDQVAELLKAKGDTKAADKLVNASKQDEQHRKAQEKKEAEHALESAWRWALLEATWTQVQAESEGQSSGPKLDEVTRHMALRHASSINQDNCKKLTKLLGLGKVAPKDGLLDWIRTTTTPGAAMLLLVMFNEVEFQHWRSAEESNAGLFLVAKAFGVDPAAIEAQTRANTRAAKATEKKAAKAEKPSSVVPSAAQATDTRGGKAKKPKPAAPATRKPKTSPEEAMQGIAAAMQEGEASAASTAESSGAADAAQGNEGTDDDVGADQGGSDSVWAGLSPAAAWPFPKNGKKAVQA